MGETERRPYEEKAVADKKRYEEQKASYLVCFLPLSLFVLWSFHLLTSPSRLARKKKSLPKQVTRVMIVH